MKRYKVDFEMSDTFLVDAETPEEARKIAKDLLCDSILVDTEYMIDNITVTEKK